MSIDLLRQLFGVEKSALLNAPRQALYQDGHFDAARRLVLRGGLGAACALAASGLPFPVRAAIELPINERRVSLANKQTGEKLNVTYFQDGIYQPDAMKQINHLLRDHHNGRETSIDPNLLDLLVKLEALLERKGEITVTSAYRTEGTNRALRSEGAAKKSMHVKGQAIDLRMPGVSLKDIRDLATALRAGGVGYYPRSRFVHLDTGNIRYW